MIGHVASVAGKARGPTTAKALEVALRRLISSSARAPCAWATTTARPVQVIPTGSLCSDVLLTGGLPAESSRSTALESGKTTVALLLTPRRPAATRPHRRRARPSTPARALGTDTDSWSPSLDTGEQALEITGHADPPGGIDIVIDLLAAPRAWAEIHEMGDSHVSLQARLMPGSCVRSRESARPLPFFINQLRGKDRRLLLGSLRPRRAVRPSEVLRDPCARRAPHRNSMAGALSATARAPRSSRTRYGPRPSSRSGRYRAQVRLPGSPTRPGRSSASVPQITPSWPTRSTEDPRWVSARP